MTLFTYTDLNTGVTMQIMAETLPLADEFFYMLNNVPATCASIVVQVLYV